MTRAIVLSSSPFGLRRPSRPSVDTFRRERRLRATTDVPFGKETTDQNSLQAVEVLRTAAEGSQSDPIVISRAFKVVEKERNKLGDFMSKADSGPDGRLWKLIFLSDKRHNKRGDKGGGYFWPFDSVTHYKDGSITNGVYLGHLGALVFEGTYSIKKNNLLEFTFNKLLLQLGPLRMTFSVKESSGRYVIFYADDECLVARGMTGGTALWRRLLPSELPALGATMI